MDVTPIAIGESVEYFDEYGKPHIALVTQVWGKFEWTPEQLEDERLVELVKNPPPIPSINLVYVDSDELKTDSYGRQITRQTSCVHESNQAAHGRYWRNI